MNLKRREFLDLKCLALILMTSPENSCSEFLVEIVDTCDNLLLLLDTEDLNE